MDPLTELHERSRVEAQVGDVRCGQQSPIRSGPGAISIRRHSSSRPQRGKAYRTVRADGRLAIDGVIEEMQPPLAESPGRFVQTWHILYDAALEQEPPGRVEWTVENAGEGLTRVRLVHGDLGQSPLTWQNVKDGWVWILDSMKTLLETGNPLPRVRDYEGVVEAAKS